MPAPVQGNEHVHFMSIFKTHQLIKHGIPAVKEKDKEKRRAGGSQCHCMSFAGSVSGTAVR